MSILTRQKYSLKTVNQQIEELPRHLRSDLFTEERRVHSHKGYTFKSSLENTQEYSTGMKDFRMKLYKMKLLLLLQVGSLSSLMYIVLSRGKHLLRHR